MSEMPKFLADDHARIRRSFHDYRRTPNSLDAALNVCDHLWIHLTIEVEMVHPAVQDHLVADEAAAMTAADEGIYRLMEALDKLEDKDPTVSSKMAALQQAVEGHISAYEKYVVPQLARRSDLMEMGSQAFGRWQKLFEERPPRTWTPMKRLANTGWGGGGRIPNSGW